MDLKTILIILSILAQIIGILAIFSKISYGQGRAKEREENLTKTIEHINIKLDNHITHIGNDVSSIKERIGYIEGTLNGKKPAK